MTTPAHEPTMAEELLSSTSADVQACQLAVDLDDIDRYEELRGSVFESIAKLEELLFTPEGTEGAQPLSDVVMASLRNFIMLAAYDAKDLLSGEEIARLKARYAEVDGWQKSLQSKRELREFADSLKEPDL